MQTFSAGDAISAGFKVIGRAPLAFLAWAVVVFVLIVLPFGWMFAKLMPMMATLGVQTPGNDAQAMTRMMNIQMQMMQWMGLLYGGMLVGRVMVGGAVYRAVLEPQARSFFYLRLGAGELWLGLVMLVLVIGYFLALLASMIPIFILTFLARAAGGDGAAAIAPLLMLVAFGVIIWGFLRLSLSLPASFAQRTFILQESWSMTRGHAGKMFLVGAAIMAIAFVAEIVLMGAGGGLFVVLGGGSGFSGGSSAQPLEGFRHVPVQAWLALGGAFALMMAFIDTMLAAAWAEIYRSLVGEAPV